MAFWRAYGLTMRPYLCFVSGAAGILGLALSPHVAWPRFLVAAAVLFLTYGVGQALTDVFQVDTDSISSPYRPLTQGRITRAQVAGVSLAALAACAVVLALLDPWNLALGALGVAGLVAYTWFKRRWWGGPLWNAWVVALLVVIGFLAGGGSAGSLSRAGVIGAAALSVLFSYAVFVLLGYFKDIGADRATGYRTLPVVAGWRPAVWVSVGFALAALAASLWLLSRVGALEGGPAPTLAIALPLWLAGAAALVGAHPRMLRLGAERDAHLAIAWTVRGFVLLHLGEATAALPALAVPALLYWAAFEWVLARRPERSQV